MKHQIRILTLALVGLLCLSLTSCTSNTTAATMQLALVTDSGLVDDQSFNQSAYEGMATYAQDNDLAYTYYIPESESTADRMAAITTAVEEGATCIILSGYLFSEAIAQVQDTFDQVNFLALDITEEDIQAYGDDAAADNVTLISYQEEQSGYLAGYAAVMDGYTQLGFVGGEAVPAVVRYGYGYIQGVNDAAQALGVDVHVNYWYGNSFLPTDDIEETMLSWYQDGTELVFSCGAAIYTSVLSAAETAGQGCMVIGVDVDQGDLSPLILTSAMKDLGNSVITALEALNANDGSWPAEYAGQEITLGASQGAIALPTTTDHWRFETFSVADYQALLDAIISGDITISDAIDTPPTTASNITVDYIG